MPQPDWTIEDYEKAGVSLPQTLADEAMMDHLHEWMKTAPDHPLKPK